MQIVNYVKVNALLWNLYLLFSVTSNKDKFTYCAQAEHWILSSKSVFLNISLYTTCVYPPALSSILVVAKVAELGKQVKKEDTVFEIPWASSSWNQTQVQHTKLTNKWKSNISASTCQICTFYLIGMYRISMFICINHCQWDRYGITNKCYGYCVSSNVRESVQGRHLWSWESADERINSQTTLEAHQCFKFLSKSRRLPSWDVTNYLNVVSRVQWGCIGHTCSNNHLKNKTIKFGLLLALCFKY